MNLNTRNTQFAVEEHALIRKRFPNESLGLRLYSANPDSGCAIIAITEGSPADRCGVLKESDIIIGVNGTSVEGQPHVGVINALKKCGKSFTLTVTRPTVLESTQQPQQKQQQPQQQNLAVLQPAQGQEFSRSPQPLTVEVFAAKFVHRILDVLVPQEMGMDGSLALSLELQITVDSHITPVTPVKDVQKRLWSPHSRKSTSAQIPVADSLSPSPSSERGREGGRELEGKRERERAREREGDREQERERESKRSSTLSTLSPSRRLLTAFKIKPSSGATAPQVGVSQHETQLLQSLRTKLGSTGILNSVDDDILVRCLIARDWNVDKAQLLVNNYVTFLLPEINPQDILATDVLSELQTGAISVTGGKDIHGAAVLELVAWRYNSKLHSPKKILATVLYLIEQAIKTQKSARRQGITLVVDTRRQSFGSFDYKSLRQVFTIQNRYPIRIDALHIISDTRFVKLAIGWLKTTSPGMRTKIFVHSTPDSVHNSIFPHQLTEHFQGTLNYDHETWINQQVRASKPRPTALDTTSSTTTTTTTTATDTRAPTPTIASSPTRTPQSPPRPSLNSIGLRNGLKKWTTSSSDIHRAAYDDMDHKNFVTNVPAGLAARRPRSKSFGEVPAAFITASTDSKSDRDVIDFASGLRTSNGRFQRVMDYLRSFAKQTAYMLKPTGTPLMANSGNHRIMRSTKTAETL